LARNFTPWRPGVRYMPESTSRAGARRRSYRRGPGKENRPPSARREVERVVRSRSFSYAVRYVARVKETTGPEIFESFLAILHHFDQNRANVGIPRIIISVRRLFRDYPLLFREFQRFLPKHEKLCMVQQFMESPVPKELETETESETGTETETEGQNCSVGT